MSIDKWLNKEEWKKKKIKRDKQFERLSEEEIKALKKKKIKNLVQKESQKSNDKEEKNEFLFQVIEFKNWLNQRTYLKGDLDRIVTWINNLYSIIKYDGNDESKSISKDEKKRLIENYKKIPPKLLDEKTRIAINKKIYGTKRTNSDNYYLRKMRHRIQERLQEAKYYEILDNILNS
ncbi:MAG: hypothetical protein ACFFHD_02920 [Promethearchaeota archaeon]